MILGAAACERKSVERYLAAGDQAMQATKLADAESNYQQAEALTPDDPRPHAALGNLYVFEQKRGPAENEYLKVLELDAHNAPAHDALGAIYRGQGELALAESQYRAAVAIDPTNATYRTNLGTLLQKENKLQDAEAELRTATGLAPKDGHAHLALANLYTIEPDRSADAGAEFAVVKAIDPGLIAAAPPVAGAPAAAASPEAGAPPPPVTASAPPPGPPATMPKVRDVERKFLLTHDSPVYETPDEGAPTVAQVHRGKFIHVTGITRKWFRIQMKNGTVGFIPITAAE